MRSMTYFRFSERFCASGVEHVLPGADFGDHYVFGREGLPFGPHPIRIIGLGLRTIGSRVSEFAVLTRQFAGRPGVSVALKERHLQKASHPALAAPISC
jgi:hypothetical protein